MVCCASLPILIYYGARDFQRHDFIANGGKRCRKTRTQAIQDESKRSTRINGRIKGERTLTFLIRSGERD
ncbi:hypothetical protein KCP74_13305 [Salmonella enterica subsp. enterica]|nr:hypothetical protein KCP74_13305 [Salmonella enterica subsp. enterica]